MDQITRRDFAVTCAAGLAGALLEAPGGALKVLTGGPPPARPRIARLRLKTHALAAMRAFYRDAIGLGIVEENPKQVIFAAGTTNLEFEEVADGSQPFYHFAFNIPENQILAARKWQLERSPLMPIPPFMRDSAYPDDIVNFCHWNAHSLFFYDPSGNVVEYIARHDMRNGREGPFGIKNILYASEIGLIVDDVDETARQVGSAAAVGQY